MLHCKTSYPSPADLESIGSKFSKVIEQAETGDTGKTKANGLVPKAVVGGNAQAGVLDLRRGEIRKAV